MSDGPTRPPRRGTAAGRLAALPLLLTLALAGAVRPLPAQSPPWTSTGPYCAATLGVTFAGPGSRRAYAASWFEPGTVFVSEDNGATWTPTEGQPRNKFEGFLDVAVDPTDDRILWVAGEGVFRSDDRGRTWENRSKNLPQPRLAWDLEIDPQDPEILHVLSGGALHKTTNGGRSWKPISQTGFILDYAVHPSDSRRVWVSFVDGIVRTTNSGRSWGAANDGLERGGGPLALDPSAPSTLYTATRGRVYKTTNGRRWLPLGEYGINFGVSTNYDASFLSLDPSRPQHLLLGLEGGSSFLPGVWRSTDGGLSWTGVGLTDEAPLGVARHPGKPKIVLVGTSAGLYRSRKGGRRLTPSQTGLFGGPVSEIAVLPAGAPAAARPLSFATTHCGLFSRDHGRPDWKLVEKEDEYFRASLAVSPADPRTLYRGMRSTQDLLESVDVSFDGGASWEIAVAWNGFQAHAVAVSPADPMRLYASAGAVGLYVSADGGATWTRPVAGSTLELTPSVLVPHPTEPDTIFASWSGLIKSTDAGTTWEKVADFTVYDLAIDPEQPETMYSVGSELRRSRNGGRSWRSIALDVPRPGELHSVVIDGENDTIYVAHTTGVLRSADEGRTWQKFDRGLPRRLEITRAPHRRLELTARGELLLATNVGVFVTRAR